MKTIPTEVPEQFFLIEIPHEKPAEVFGFLKKEARDLFLEKAIDKDDLKSIYIADSNHALLNVVNGMSNYNCEQWLRVNELVNEYLICDYEKETE